jgi:iron complex transport system ATP-binding protein
MTGLSRPLEIVGASVRYGERVGLNAVDLTVAPGEFVALAGPNGSGKTTLIRLALGLLEPDAGTVRLFGDPVAQLPIAERARRVAWVPQSEEARDDVPLADYVEFGRYAHRGTWARPTPDDVGAVARALEAVGLSDRAADGILTLSGGERQRATLARALAQAAPLLLLDEPTSHLDIGHQLDLLERVRKLGRTGGVTVVAALHDLNLASRFADRIVVLSRGRRVADGPPESILSEELLLRVWGVASDLRRDPTSHRSYLIPHRLASPARPSGGVAGYGPVHVIGGGGAAASILRALVDEGFRVTTGVLNLLDTDAETAEVLGIPVALEAPFVPVGPEALERLRVLLAEARAVVLSPVPFGPSNVANLEALAALDPRPAILLVAPRDRPAWDFTGGRAGELLKAIRAAGAVDCDGVAELLAALRPLAAGGAGGGAVDRLHAERGPAGRLELPDETR